MAYGQRSSVQVPYWPDSEDVLESEYARIEYHLLEDRKERDDIESMADYYEFPWDGARPPFGEMDPFQLRDGAEEVDEDRANTMRRRYCRQIDDVEAEDCYAHSPTPASRRLPIEATYTRGSPRVVSRPSEFTTSNDMIDQELEYRRKLVFELKLGQFRLSVLSKPTAPGNRTGYGLYGFLWVMLATVLGTFLLHWVFLA